MRPVPLPPERMSRVRRGRLRKSWRWLGVFSEDVAVVVGRAEVAGAVQGFWAVLDRPGRRLEEHTARGDAEVVLEARAARVRTDRVRVTLALEPDGEPIEVASPHGEPATRPPSIWTRKTPVRARGEVVVDGVARPLHARGLLDESAGYHARHTRWAWAAGVGRAQSGEAVAWNLVTGLHDRPGASERRVWVDGVARELGPVRFTTDHAALAFDEGGALHFAPEAVRARRDGVRGVVASDYRQPFVAVRGVLPPGLVLAEGVGVTERHRATW